MEMRVFDNEILLGEVCKLLSEGKRVKLKAKGESMRPFIRDGDTLIIAPANDFQKGDIVLAGVEDGRFVVHRIIGLTATEITLMGDGNLYGKELCRPAGVYGKVESIIHDGKEVNVSGVPTRIMALFRHHFLALRRLRHRLLNLKNRQTYI